MQQVPLPGSPSEGDNVKIYDTKSSDALLSNAYPHTVNLPPYPLATAPSAFSSLHIQELPHEPLHNTRFLRPFKPAIQEHVSDSHIDAQEPSRLEPQPVITSYGLGIIVLGNVARLISQTIRNMDPPNQPRYDEISRLDKRRRYH